MQTNGITYVLNVSTTCQKPPFIQDGHFLRIPIIDNYSDKLLPFFQDAFQFLGMYRMYFVVSRIAIVNASWTHFRLWAAYYVSSFH